VHETRLALGTIHKTLIGHQVAPLCPYRGKARYTRYPPPIPADRVQRDTCKSAPGLYQYTFIDDGTRYRVLALYDRRTAVNTVLFIDKVIEEMPFPI